MKMKYMQITLYTNQINKECVHVKYNPSTGRIWFSSFYVKPYSEHDKEYNRNNREILNNIKQGMGCALCGFRKYPESLNFHHVNPKDKKYHVTAARITKKSFFDEMQKCICLCANCHQHITQIERR